MSDFSLEAVLSDEPVQADAVQAAEVVEPETGEEAGTPPVEEGHPEQQDDPVARKHKGLEAAAVAERQKRQAAEQRAQQLEAQLREFQQQKQPTQQKQTEQLARPKRDEFESQEEYEDALLDFGDRRRELRQQQEAQERQAREQAEQIERAATDVIAKGQTAFADFDAVINTGLGPLLSQGTQQSHLFRQALLTGERGHEVAYYLGQNAAEAQRIYALPPMQMVRAVSLIEATKLDALPEAEEPRAKPQLPKTLTQARDARTGQFKPDVYSGPTPLDQVLASKQRR
jgi:multidrug efflux pump subunit AcrA (membrane-fusion protein)